MDAKLDKISELSNILCEKESLGQKIFTSWMTRHWRRPAVTLKV